MTTFMIIVLSFLAFSYVINLIVMLLVWETMGIDDAKTFFRVLLLYLVHPMILIVLVPLFMTSLAEESNERRGKMLAQRKNKDYREQIEELKDTIEKLKDGKNEDSDN